MTPNRYADADEDRSMGYRAAFLNRPTKGKTKRKRMLPPHGTKTNVGDPMLHGSSNALKKGNQEGSGKRRGR